ncbi:tRNA (adenosine(37)-N6)-dimethylallyltransferase MiaA [Roseibium denhamense]|nr:tRNA (adenosine(37)-N6)-dimethylallyltransferase MiaA [Roseibium denhamense]MTI06522.1 tRNA (adenosine(37)-N6)-dimethylallyltransferase MiaA [Roseibium denhamense]
MGETLKSVKDRTVTGRAILIAGPTASGKSALSLELAEKLNGVVVNADSMQLYEELRLVSARPSPDEERRVPHRLYGVLPAATPFSTGAWLRRMAHELSAVWREDELPILVGGTGLYFKALTEGFAELPEIGQADREFARGLAAEAGVDGLRRALIEAGDPEGAAAWSDPQRLARALEVIRATGRPLSAWQTDHQTAPLLEPESCCRIVLAPPRPWLHERIALRADLMLSAEGLAEVEGLLAQELPPDLPAMRAIGVREIGSYLTGQATREQAVHSLTVATRQYAKRQETWFRNQMADWQRIDPSSEIDLSPILDTFR